METRLLGRKAGLVQRNVGGGYSFEAHIYREQDGNLYDIAVASLPEKAKSAYYSFVEAIITGTPHPAPAEEGLAVMRILDALYASSRTGRPVELR